MDAELEEYELGASDAQPGTKGNAIVSEQAVREGEAPDLDIKEGEDDWGLEAEDNGRQGQASGSGHGGMK